MGAIRTILVALTLLAVPASAALGSIAPLDTVADDASDDPEKPSPLERPGSYDGFLHPPTDQDWYSLERNGWYSGGGEDPACVSVTFQGAVQAGTYLWSDTDAKGGDYFVNTGISPVDDAAMGLVIPRFTKAVFGISSEESEASQLGPHSGFYEFSVDAQTIDDLEPFSPPEEGLPACLAPLVPAESAFTQPFTVDERVNFTISAAEALGVGVSLQQNAGVVIPDLIPPLDDQKIASVSLEAGTYDLVVENFESSESNPLLGVTLGPDDDDDDDDDPRRPCYPNC